jgi:hypothetical protein
VLKVRTVQKIKSEGKNLVTTGQGNSSFSTPNKRKETAKEMSLDLTSLIYA